MIDPFIASQYRERTAKSWGAGIVLTAWQGHHPGHRAAMIYAQGDPQRAGACDPNWKLLADGDLVGALKASRNQDNPYAMQLEAETLITAGSLIAGLERLQKLHNKGLVSASLSLTRRLYMLGDFDSALTVALSLPWHAHVVMLGARSAIMKKDYDTARRMMEPLLLGIVPVPDTEAASGLMVITATLLLQSGEYERLQNFIRSILMSMDLPDALLPGVARSAWMAGFGQQAWDRMMQHQSQYAAAACAELAILVGNVEVAQKWIKTASYAASPMLPALRMLTGEVFGDVKAKAEAERIFSKGQEVHIWRTHPHRWTPWLRAAQETKAVVKVYDLKKGEIPEANAKPVLTMDDSALVEILPPLVTPTVPRPGNTVWVSEDLCSGFSVPLDWPDSETDYIYGLLKRAESPDEATLVITSAEKGMELADGGRPVVVIAPPGDPFWNGPLPEKAWPGMGMVRSSVERGWTGAGMHVVQIAKDLFKIMVPYFEGKSPAPADAKSNSAKSSGRAKTKNQKSSSSKGKGRGKGKRGGSGGKSKT